MFRNNSFSSIIGYDKDTENVKTQLTTDTNMCETEFYGKLDEDINERRIVTIYILNFYLTESRIYNL